MSYKGFNDSSDEDADFTQTPPWLKKHKKQKGSETKKELPPNDKLRVKGKFNKSLQFSRFGAKRNGSSHSIASSVKVEGTNINELPEPKVVLSPLKQEPVGEVNVKDVPVKDNPSKRHFKESLQFDGNGYASDNARPSSIKIEDTERNKLTDVIVVLSPLKQGLSKAVSVKDVPSKENTPMKPHKFQSSDSSLCLTPMKKNKVFRKKRKKPVVMESSSSDEEASSYSIDSKKYTHRSKKQRSSNYAEGNEADYSGSNSLRKETPNTTPHTGDDKFRIIDIEMGDGSLSPVAPQPSSSAAFPVLKSSNFEDISGSDGGYNVEFTQRRAESSKSATVGETHKQRTLKSSKYDNISGSSSDDALYTQKYAALRNKEQDVAISQSSKETWKPNQNVEEAFTISSDSTDVALAKISEDEIDKMSTSISKIAKPSSVVGKTKISNSNIDFEIPSESASEVTDNDRTKNSTLKQGSDLINSSSTDKVNANTMEINLAGSDSELSGIDENIHSKLGIKPLQQHRDRSNFNTPSSFDGETQPFFVQDTDDVRVRPLSRSQNRRSSSDTSTSSVIGETQPFSVQMEEHGEDMTNEIPVIDVQGVSQPRVVVIDVYSDPKAKPFIDRMNSAQTNSEDEYKSDSSGRVYLDLSDDSFDDIELKELWTGEVLDLTPSVRLNQVNTTCTSKTNDPAIELLGRSANLSNTTSAAVPVIETNNRSKAQVSSTANNSKAMAYSNNTATKNAVVHDSSVDEDGIFRKSKKENKSNVESTDYQTTAMPQQIHRDNKDGPYGKSFQKEKNGITGDSAYDQNAVSARKSNGTAISNTARESAVSDVNALKCIDDTKKKRSLNVKNDDLFNSPVRIENNEELQENEQKGAIGNDGTDAKQKTQNESEDDSSFNYSQDDDVIILEEENTSSVYDQQVTEVPSDHDNSRKKYFEKSFELPASSRMLSLPPVNVDIEAAVTPDELVLQSSDFDEGTDLLDMSNIGAPPIHRQEEYFLPEENNNEHRPKKAKNKEKNKHSTKEKRKRTSDKLKEGRQEDKFAKDKHSRKPKRLFLNRPAVVPNDTGNEQRRRGSIGRTLQIEVPPPLLKRHQKPLSASVNDAGRQHSFDKKSFYSDKIQRKMEKSRSSSTSAIKPPSKHKYGPQLPTSPGGLSKSVISARQQLEQRRKEKLKDVERKKLEEKEKKKEFLKAPGPHQRKAHARVWLTKTSRQDSLTTDMITAGRGDLAAKLVGRRPSAKKESENGNKSWAEGDAKQEETDKNGVPENINASENSTNIVNRQINTIKPCRSETIETAHTAAVGTNDVLQTAEVDHGNNTKKCISETVESRSAGLKVSGPVEQNKDSASLVKHSSNQNADKTPEKIGTKVLKHQNTWPNERDRTIQKGALGKPDVPLERPSMKKSNSFKEQRQPSTSYNAFKLTREHFLHRMLKWNPAWLWEQESMDSRPPILGSASIFSLLETYNSYEDYCKITEPLLLLEIWERITKDFQRERHDKVRMALLNSAQGGGFHFNILNFHGVMKRSPPSVSIGDLVILTSDAENGAGSTKEKIRYTFGYVERVDFHGVLIPDVQKQLGPLAKQPDCQPSSIEIRVGHKEIPLTLNVLHEVQVVSSLISHMRHMDALINLEKSRLCSDILRPIVKRNYVFIGPDSKLNENLKVDSSFNPAQTGAIRAAVSAALEEYAHPRMVLVQGPPGTGKSRTVIGMCMKILEESKIRKKDMKILLCAPSNAATDEVTLRLLIERDRMKRSTRGKPFSISRVGNYDSIKDPRVRRVTLAEQARKYTSDLARQRNFQPLPESVRQELEKMKKVLSELEMKKNDLVSQGKTDEADAMVSLIEDKHKKKKQIEFGISKRDRLKVDMEKEGKRKCLSDADIVCSTLNSSGGDKLMETVRAVSGDKLQKFNCVIVDEASQCTEVDCLIPLQYHCSKLIMVGDPMQLPPTVLSKKADELSFGQSLFQRLYNHFESEEITNNVPSPVHLLDTQYRMHPEIARFPAAHFYHGKLKTSSRASFPRYPLQRYMLINTNGPQARETKENDSWVNEFEARVVVELCEMLQHRFRGQPVEIGVITFYRSQKECIINKLNMRDNSVEVNTVDAFQGREKDIIILSCVRSRPREAQGIGFLSRIQRLNVALTRAKAALYIIGNHETLQVDCNWSKLIEDAAKRRKIRTLTTLADLRRIQNWLQQ